MLSMLLHDVTTSIAAISIVTRQSTVATVELARSKFEARAHDVRTCV
jgi:hypothetical protein